MSTSSVTITAAPGVPFIDIAREFDAPVEAVYRAHRDPQLVQQWLGPNGLDTTIETYDVRTGGSYRFVQSQGSQEYAFHGVFHVARPNDFIIQTFEFEDFPDVVSIQTLTFQDLGDGRTRLVSHSTYPSQEARDGMLASDMARGITEGYERLDALLAAL